MEVLDRKTIDQKYKWDLSSMFENDDAFLTALAEAKVYPEKYQAYKGRISTSGKVLYQFLVLDDEIDIVLGKLINYAQRKSDEDTRVSKYQDYSSQVMSLYVTISNSVAWFVPELLGISETIFDQFYEDEPKLTAYKRKLDRILAKRAHTLTPAEEAILASAGELASQPENVFSMFSDADLSFEDAVDENGEKHAVTHGSYGV